MNFESFLQAVYTIIHWIDAKMTFLVGWILRFLAAHPEWVWRVIFFAVVVMFLMKWDKKLKAKAGGKGNFGAKLLRALLWIVAIQIVLVLLLSVYLSTK